jgi:hypothetical protein
MAKGIARMGVLFLSLLVITAAHAVTVGDLLISEIMVNPAAVSDARGEWFELYNPTDDEINLRGIVIGDDGRDSHKIETDLLILPGHFLTLGRNGDALSNGGFVADYVYDDFTLSNSGDEILLSEGPIEHLRLDYGGSFDVAGQSRELTGLSMIESSYSLTLAGLTYGLGDIGTPGEHGSFSLAPSAVPLPAAAWLFITGVLVMLKAVPSKARGTPARANVIPAQANVIPAQANVIPAQAGISKHSGNIRPQVDPYPKRCGLPA